MIYDIEQLFLIFRQHQTLHVSKNLLKFGHQKYLKINKTISHFPERQIYTIYIL